MNDDTGDWRDFIRDGDRLLKTADAGGKKRPRVFTPEILYNLIAMAIEKHVMGYLLFNNRLPDNHTLRDLMDAARQVGELDAELHRKTVAYDRFQEICAIAAYHRDVPDAEDTAAFLRVACEVRDFVSARTETPG